VARPRVSFAAPKSSNQCDLFQEVGFVEERVYRLKGMARVFTALIIAMASIVVAYAAQAPPGRKDRPSAAWVMTRTPDGQPDLQGNWNFRSPTPLERPPEFADKEFLSDADVAAVERRAGQLLQADRPDGTLMNTPPWWLDFGTRVAQNRRSSLIVDPRDGRLPAMTPQGLMRQADQTRARATLDGPESLNPWERCITRGLPAVMLPSAYNNYLQLLQTPGFVVIVTEMIHEARIVPLGGPRHLPDGQRAWMGDSRGRWDGNTLVVDTTNFSEQADFWAPVSGGMRYMGGGGRLRLTERFTRIDVDTIDYRFTVDDPATWTRPWTVAVPLTRTNDRIFEYACHEANYNVTHMLGAARSAGAPKGR